MIKNHILYTDYSNWTFDLAKAEGSYLWDSKGKKYIDFSSGWNVTNLGWNNPEINEAVKKQAEKNVFAPMWTADPVQEELAQELISSLPKELDAVCRATGGTEANEEAIKIARAATGRKKVIGFADTYHGQSFGAMSIGYRPELVEPISPMVPQFIQLEYPTKEDQLKKFLIQLEELLSKKDIAAIITESGVITGWGSVSIAPKGYLTEVRKLTSKYGTLLILDEVGTGYSRLGRLFSLEFENVVPDIITLAKGMSNGASPIGAAVLSSKVAEPVIPTTNITSTFGWTPLACSAALKTLQIHKRDKVWKQSEENGRYLLEQLKLKLKQSKKVKDIRGVGMEIGIEFVPEVGITHAIVQKALDAGLHFTHDLEKTIQIMPPLTTPKNLLDQGVEILVQTLLN